MNNDIRLSTFSIRHELGPTSLTYRLPTGELTRQQVVDSPKLVSLSQIPGRVKSGFGLSSIELMDGNLTAATEEERSQLPGAAEREGVRIGTVGIGRAIADANDAYREEDLSEVERLIEQTAEVGAPSVRVVLMPPPILPQMTPAPFDVIVEVLGRLADFAEGRGLKLLIENDDELTSDPAKITAILDAVGPRLGLILDTGNWSPVMDEVASSFLEQRQPQDLTDLHSLYDAVKSMLPRADVVHLKTYGFHADGSSRVYDLDRILDILSSGGYEGPLTIECMLPVDSSNTDDVIRTTIDRIRSTAAVPQ